MALRRVDPEETRKVLRQVNEQKRGQRTFKVTYVYRADAQTSAAVSHTRKGPDKQSVYRNFCRLRENDGLLDFLVATPHEQKGVHVGALLAFPARNVYRIYIEEVDEK